MNDVGTPSARAASQRSFHAEPPHRDADKAPGLRIGLLNVKYSPNLGDGLLSECLERELVSALPGCAVRPLDLGGRDDYGGGRHRAAALSLLGSVPAPVRRAAVKVVLGRSLVQRHRPLWRRTLAEVDAVVVGGGNLLSDSDLNFPLKLAAALGEAARFRLPTAVFGVGVSDNWSREGEALFRGALAREGLVHAMVRDARSGEIWARRLGPAGVRAALVGQDPALLAFDHFPAVARRGPAEAPVVGIGLTHPLLLNYHADEHSLSRGRLTAWMADLVTLCLARGWRVALFTNGSPEDVRYLDATAGRLLALGSAGRVTRAPTPGRPADLAKLISAFDVVLAHRLHANIAAFSYGIPHIGFTWDAKMKSFFARMGMTHRLCRPGADAPERVVAIAAESLASGIDPARRGQAIEQARRDVAELAAALREGVAASVRRNGSSRVPVASERSQWT